MIAEDRDVAIPDLLARLARRLDAMAEDVHEIEQLIAEAPMGDTVPDAAGITKLQRLDFVRQALEDMALLSLFAARHCEGVLPGTFARKLRLDATRALFTPADTAWQDAAQPRASAGEVDLF